MSGFRMHYKTKQKESELAKQPSHRPDDTAQLEADRWEPRDQMEAHLQDMDRFDLIFIEIILEIIVYNIVVNLFS